jgi:transcriptional regulator with XRE-family HTH domain
LRREEVAELADIGIGWYTFLEQGRNIRPSERALLRIARALQLGPDERKYLLDLALETAPRSRAEEVVTPVLRHVVTRAMASPAAILGQRWDILEYNQAANALLDLDYAPARNILQLWFTPEVRAFDPNWGHAARQTVSAFRASNARFLRDPWITSLVDDCKRGSQELSAWWAEQGVSEAYSGHLTTHHPFVGRLEFEYTSLQPPDSPNLTVRVFEPCDTDTGERVHELIRQLRSGERSSTHNLWTALRARAPR